MKHWARLSLLLVSSVITFGQNPAPTLTQIVEKFVIGGYRDGFGEKEMRRAGDATAVALTKVLSNRTINDAEVEDALYSLNMAFSNSSLIENSENRDPKTTLFVLAYLDLCTKNPALKQKIDATRRNISGSNK